MLLVLSKFLIVTCWLHVTFAIHQYESNNGLRGSRPRNGNKRQPSPIYSLENNGADNQWKPILDLPPNHSAKYRKPKPDYRQLLKHSPNVIFTTEYYPKQLHQSASTNFVANQSLLVASDYFPQQLKGPPSKTKHQKQQQHTGGAQQYEVHEQINEDSGGYDSRYRYPEPLTGKPVTAPVTEKHIHYVHYHKGTVLHDGRHLGRPTVRKVRLSATSRRPY
ncbi:hypothetical protein CBL_11136 [Carabus blaptoides fortunei]